ncbi:MAG: NADH-quinone oxidoreductase subunit J [Candidatus Micrarchaeaceae archaeon]
MYVLFYLFLLIAAVELALSVYIFRARELLHAIVLLALLFVMTSMLYLVLSQPLLATVQLLILVGGVSTYLLVGTASESFSKFRHTNIALMLALAIVTFAVIFYPVASNATSPYYASDSNATVFTLQQQAQFVKGDMAIFYIGSLLLFGIGIGAIALYKKLGGRK